MLTHHRKPVCLSLISTDLPLSSVMETAGTLYQKDTERFHLLLTAPTPKNKNYDGVIVPGSPRLLWLEISPYRVTMTMQGNAQLSYRHFWEEGVYGMSRYWLPVESLQPQQPVRLRNFTRHLSLTRSPLPENLRVEYELWAGKVQLGQYILNLDIEN